MYQSKSGVKYISFCEGEGENEHMESKNQKFVTWPETNLVLEFLRSDKIFKILCTS